MKSFFTLVLSSIDPRVLRPLTVTPSVSAPSFPSRSELTPFLNPTMDVYKTKPKALHLAFNHRSNLQPLYFTLLLPLLHYPTGTPPATKADKAFPKPYSCKEVL